MPTVTLTLPHHRYDIRIEPGAYAHLGEWVREVAPHARAALLADERVKPLVERATASLSRAGYGVVAHAQAFGEDRKNLDTVGRLYDVLLDRKLERRSPVIALGGGVVGDTVGFVAATYLRGVPFIQCPTTLLAMVDASVGGKVGVNVPQGKNLIGAFHQPALVVIDTHALRSLPPREVRCGLAECVKHAVIRDAALFDWIDRRLDDVLALSDEALVELVRWNVEIKARIVMADEKETGERALLNLGHTFGHAIESSLGYGVYEHGEAVALGLVASSRLAAGLGRCERELPQRIEALLRRIGLPVASAKLPPTEVLMDAMTQDKKVKDGRVRLVLPDRMGAASVVTDAPPHEVRRAWDSLR
jgi:3-dehydroquinate synthase